MGEPSYLALHREGTLKKRVDEALACLKECRLCPRECGIDRLADERGFCGTGRYAKVASAGPHFGEETPLVGRGGSGTIFFSSCNLLCSFCQNYDISHLKEGVEVDAGDLALMMMRLSRSGCHNINFVTPTHVVPQILEGLLAAVEHGISVPLVYNTGGYDSVETLKLLDGVIDIYMPDFKFWYASRAERFCRASDYRERAIDAIREMHRQVGDLVLDAGGIAERGLLVRHLVMPNDVAGTGEVMKFLAGRISPDTYVNVMDQYRPCFRADTDAMINRPVTGAEFRRAVEAAREAGLTRLDPRKRFMR
ncbi:MAG: radical SAM protein [Deltaproteobacteria bacterium]|nr:radical SAM protein [Deltaproteobacteria bacterium]